MPLPGPPPLVVVDGFRLGDACYTGALVAALRRHLPDRPLHVVVDPAVARLPIWAQLEVGVLPEPFPWLRAAEKVSPAAWLASWTRLRGWRRRLRGAWGIDPRGDVRHDFALRALGVERRLAVPRRPGCRRGWQGEHEEHLFTTRLRWWQTHAESLGLPVQPGPTWPWIRAAALPPAAGGRPGEVILSYEASNPLRHWNRAACTEVARQLAGEGIACTLITQRSTPREPTDTAFHEVWTGEVEALCARLARAAVVVAVDSFPGHFAAAAGVPVVSLFGPALPQWTRPWGERVTVLEPVGTFACRPCRQDRCVQPHHWCMDTLRPAAVVAAVRRHLGRAAVPG